jgi:hypothetical protein
VLQEVVDMVGSHIKFCERELAKLQASAPRIVTTQQRLCDLLLLLLTGCWVFYAMGMGSGQQLVLGGEGSLLRLPLGYGGVETAVAVMLLLAAVQRFVFVKVH